MNQILTFFFLFTILPTGALAYNGKSNTLCYRGSLTIDSVEVTKKDSTNSEKTKTYKVLKQNTDFFESEYYRPLEEQDASITHNFTIWQNGGMYVGDVTRCPPYVGETTKDLFLRAKVTQVTTDCFEYTEEAPKSIRDAIIEVPKGTSVYGTCNPRNPDELFYIYFIRKSDDINPVSIKLQRP